MFKLTGILLISIASSQAFTSFYFVIMDYVAAVLCRVNVDFQLKSFFVKTRVATIPTLNMLGPLDPREYSHLSVAFTTFKPLIKSSFSHLTN